MKTKLTDQKLNQLLIETKECLILDEHEVLGINLGYGISAPCIVHNGNIKEVHNGEISNNIKYQSQSFCDIYGDGFVHMLIIFNEKTLESRPLIDLEYKFINIDIVSIRSKKKAFEESLEGIKRRAQKAKEDILLKAKLNALFINS